MDQDVNILAIFYGIVSLQGYLVAFTLFFVKKGNRKANRILGLLTFLLAYYLTDFFMGQVKFFHTYPHLLYISVPIWFLFAPLSYLYIRTVLNQKKEYKLRDLLHLLPFLFMIYRLRQFYMLPGDIKLMYWTGELLPPEGTFFNYIVALINPLQGLFYISFVLTIISYARKNITKHTVTEAQLNWLKFFFTLMLVYFASSYTFILLYFSNNLFYDFLVHVHLGIFAFITYGIAFISISNPEKLFPADIIPLKKKVKFNFSEEQVEQYTKSLNELMTKNKYYLNPELKYSDLAAELGISVRQLSELFNREMGRTFNDYVNSFRVEAVKKQIEQNVHQNNTLLSIALSAGFSSKASFNRIFKKHTGITPSAYMLHKEISSVSAN